MKIIKHQNEARLKLKSGVQKLNEVVKHTLGPAGKQVIIGDESLDPISSDDGITVANAVELQDELENVGAQLARAAARKTNKIAGDGTTTTIVLTNAFTQELVQEGLLIQDQSFKTKLLEAQEKVLAWLDQNKIEITSKDQVEHIATISSGDSEVGRIISEIYEKLGKDGVTTYEENKTIGLDYEIVEGFQFDRGLVSPHLASDRVKLKSVIKDARILITDKKVLVGPKLAELATGLVQQGKNELVIVADEFPEATINNLIVNALNGFRVTAIKAPHFGDRRREFLDDLAAFTGGKVVDLEQATLDDLGKAQSVEVTLGRTLVVGGAGDISERVEQLKASVETTQSEYDLTTLKERISKLTGGVGVIRVGCATELETRSKLAKVEDAINATRVALEDGIVEGGGVALLKASETIDNEVFKKALQAPHKQIVENGGEFDQTNLIERGIIDPVKVTKNALMNALSTALHIRLTEALVVPEREDKDDE